MKYPIFILILLISFFSLKAQTPYFYNSDGTHGSVNDKNWNVTTLKLNENFVNEATTKVNWKYYSLGHIREVGQDQFYLEGDNCYDNYTGCGPYDWSNDHGHSYNTRTETMRLSSRFHNPTISAYYTDRNDNYQRKAKAYKITTGLAISKMAYKYGFFEARFKVNRPAGPQ